ncbi:MAG: hypothetical protein ACPGDB_00860 [Fusobacterium sp.]
MKFFENLKFDIELEDYSKKEKEELKNNIKAGNRKIFVAGSTRTGEAEVLLEVFKHLENYLLVLVPRHLERIPKLEKLIEENKFSFEKFSEIKEEKDILIVDKMGILRKFYSISDVAFVGGTLVNIGGHSLLEPLYYRKTPIFGKYLQNVKDISKEILKRNIGFKVETSEDILKIIKKIENHEIKNEEIEDFFNKNKNEFKNIKPGENINLQGPLGTGFNTDIENKNIVIIGGGMGMAPMKFLTEVLSPKNNVTFICGGRNKESMNILDNFNLENIETIITTDDGSLGIKGNVTIPLLETLKNKNIYKIYTCGPQIMMKHIMNIAKKNNILCEVSLEERMGCGVGACVGCSILTKEGMKKVCKDGPVFDSKIIIND